MLSFICLCNLFSVLGGTRDANNLCSRNGLSQASEGFQD